MPVSQTISEAANEQMWARLAETMSFVAVERWRTVVSVVNPKFRCKRDLKQGLKI